MINKKYLDDLEYRITGACIEVHKALGPGLSESVYQRCLEREFEIQDIDFIAELTVAISYKGTLLDTKLRADLFIDNCIVLELKSVELLLPIHYAQILTYMKILKAPKGILINFNSTNIIQNGKKPFINEFYNLL